MILFAILFSIIKSQQIDFMIMGFSTNLHIIYQSPYTYNYDSCSRTICYVASNTTSSYIILYPLKKITSCSKLPSMFNVMMTSFILTKKDKMLLPFTCNTIGDCLTNGCINYKSSNESFYIAFTGKCLL